MRAVILLTGAGASKPLGYPITTEFFPKDAPVPGHMFPVLQEVAAILEHPDPLDVEDALRVLQPADDFLRTESGRLLGGRLSDQWAVRVPELAQHIRERCFDLYGRYPDESEVKTLYTELFDLSGWRRSALDLFTANYDPVTDVLLDIAKKEKLHAYDGFGALARWEPELYEWTQPGLRVFRLHGSMSWVRDDARILNTRDYSIRRGDQQRHLLLFPGFKGDPEADRLHEVFQFANRRLRSALMSGGYLVAIGYSFRDRAINEAITDALTANAGLRIIVVNPEFPTGLGGFLTKLAESLPSNVFHVKGAFGSAATLMDLEPLLPAGMRGP